MNGFRFGDPFWLLLLLPVLGGAWWRARQQKPAVVFSSIRRLDVLPETWTVWFQRRLAWLRTWGLCCLVVGLARPQKGREDYRVRAEGIAIEMCIDRSGSMQAHDFQLDGQPVDRLTAVKKVFRDFVSGAEELSGRPNDRIGLIEFGGFANAMCPLTLDHGVLLEVLGSVQIPKPIRDQRGRIINQSLLEEEMSTAIGDALLLAVDRLRDIDAKSKVIILLSDGENTAGVIAPEEAADAAKAAGIKIYAIGVGRTGRAPFPALDPLGNRVFVPRVVRLDEETLRKIAATTDGRYFNAEDTAALNDVYAEIDQLEKTISEGRIYMRYRELFSYWIVPGLACVLLEITLASTRFRTLP